MEPLVVYDEATLRRRRIIIGLVAVLIVAGLLAGLQYTGLLALERHSGYFAPTWDSRGEQVFFIQRNTLGIVWGLGWEEISPPAYAYVINDQVSLCRLHLEDGRIDVLRHLESTPARGRVLRNYRGRIFGPLAARISVRGGGLDFMARIDVPGENVSDRSPSPAMVPHGGYSDNPLAGGVELIAVPGRESYPAAVVAVSEDGDYDLLLQNDRFNALYPEPLPPAMLEQWSRRRMIERERELEQRVANLVRDYRARGMDDTEIDRALLEIGYIPVGPRIIASRIGAPEPDDRVFGISPVEFEGGLYADIRRAIEQPGTAVFKQREDYIGHRDFDDGRDLNAWLAAGNRSFVIRYQDQYYRLLIVQ